MLRRHGADLARAAAGFRLAEIGEGREWARRVPAKRRGYFF
jgi:hypothetical protein